jgi:ABC-type antimicrobial peptide transport system permease subunit
MIGDVEAKTYEFGMLRALGFNKAWLVVLLLIEALIFASKIHFSFIPYNI